jgi:hypothetical protein
VSFPRPHPATTQVRCRSPNYTPPTTAEPHPSLNHKLPPHSPRPPPHMRATHLLTRRPNHTSTTHTPMQCQLGSESVARPHAMPCHAMRFPRGGRSDVCLCGAVAIYEARADGECVGLGLTLSQPGMQVPTWTRADAWRGRRLNRKRTYMWLRAMQRLVSWRIVSSCLLSSLDI